VKEKAKGRGHLGPVGAIAKLNLRRSRRRDLFVMKLRHGAFYAQTLAPALSRKLTAICATLASPAAAHAGHGVHVLTAVRAPHWIANVRATMKNTRELGARLPFPDSQTSKFY